MSPTKILRQWEFTSEADLEQAKQLKDNYDNDNYSDYIEYASVHGWTNIKVGVRWLAAIRIE
jgi:hypothetical protein